MSFWIVLDRLGRVLVPGLIGIIGLLGVAVGLGEIIGEHKIVEGVHTLIPGVLALVTCVCLAMYSRPGKPARPEFRLVLVAILGMYLVTYGFMLGIGVVSERPGPPERPGRRTCPEAFMIAGGALISAALTDWLLSKRKSVD